MKFFALVALALVGSANAADIQAFTSVTRTGTLATGATMVQAGNIVFTLQTATDLADDKAVIITSDNAIWAGAGDAGCSVDQSGAKTVKTAVVSGANKILTVTMGGAASKDAPIVITCTLNLANLGGAGAEVFKGKTTDDAEITCAAPYTVNAGKAIWGGVTRGTVKAGAASGLLRLQFNTTNAIAANGKFKLTASAAIFSADDADGSATTGCTVTSAGTQNAATWTTNAIKANYPVVADVKKSIEVQVTNAIAAGKTVVLSCTGANLAANAAAGTAAYTFGFETSGDIVALTTQTGYTVAGQVAWGSASVATTASGVAPGTLSFSFTPVQGLAATKTIKLTSSADIWAGATPGVTCTAAECAENTCNIIQNVPKTVTSSAADANKKLLTITMGATTTAAKKLLFNCTQARVNPAAGPVYFDIETSEDTFPLTNQTGYTVTAAPTKMPTKAAAAATGNKTTVAAASTDGVSTGVAFTALCLAATALRQ
jgi:hypothetical protein